MCMSYLVYFWDENKKYLYSKLSFTNLLRKGKHQRLAHSGSQGTCWRGHVWLAWDKWNCKCENKAAPFCHCALQLPVPATLGDAKYFWLSHRLALESYRNICSGKNFIQLSWVNQCYHHVSGLYITSNQVKHDNLYKNKHTKPFYLQVIALKLVDISNNRNLIKNANFLDQSAGLNTSTCKRSPRK